MLFVIQYIRCFKNFWGSANILWQIPLEMGKNWFWVQHIPWNSKILFCFWIKASSFLKWSYSQRCFDVVPNVAQFNVEIHNVVSTFLNNVNFNVDVHNVVSMLIWRCVTLRRHISLKATMNRRWNVC